MKSPFPGMDPYLESYWLTVHHNLITDAQEQLNEQLPGDLLALVGERVFVESQTERRHIYPDVYVAQYPQVHASSAFRSGTAAVAEPIVIKLPQEPVVQGYLEIREADTGNRLVTVIEFVSPSNKKSGDGRDLYVKKQQECLAGRVSLVEIDLVRHGEWVLSIPHIYVPPMHRSTYQACVRRGWQIMQAEFYALSIRDGLPSIRIPLRERDNDVTLDLQSLIDRSYQRGRFGSTLSYGIELDPPLDKEDAAWADELLRTAGRRAPKSA